MKLFEVIKWKPNSIIGVFNVSGASFPIQYRSNRKGAPNNIAWSEDMPGVILVDLGNGYIGYVDKDIWFNWAHQFKWYAQVIRKPNEEIAAAYMSTAIKVVDPNTGKSKRQIVGIHRMIMSSADGNLGPVVDHIDGSGLNNRRSNLQIASRSLNVLKQNRRHKSNTGQRNIHHLKKQDLYRVGVRVDGKLYFWDFKKLEEAITHRDKVFPMLVGKWYRGDA